MIQYKKLYTALESIVQVNQDFAQSDYNFQQHILDFIQDSSDQLSA